MNNGLYIICSPGGYYNYVRVGYLKRVAGDEYVIIGARVLKRFGQHAELSMLAVKGPQGDTQLLSEAAHPSPIHRLHIYRPEVANKQAWEKHLPAAIAAMAADGL